MLALKSSLSAAAALAVVSVTSVAQACPVCAQRDENGVMRYAALAVLVALPWFLGGAAIAFIRRALRAERVPTNAPETT